MKETLEPGEQGDSNDDRKGEVLMKWRENRKNMR